MRGGSRSGDGEASTGHRGEVTSGDEKKCVPTPTSESVPEVSPHRKPHEHLHRMWWQIAAVRRRSSRSHPQCTRRRLAIVH